MLKTDGERFRFLMWNGCVVDGDGPYVKVEWWQGDGHFAARGYTLREAVDNAIEYAIPETIPPEEI